MTTSTFNAQAERVDLTQEGIEYYAAKLVELSDSLKETLQGKHPEDALALLVQIQDTAQAIERRTLKHISPERAEAFWARAAKAKAREM